MTRKYPADHSHLQSADDAGALAQPLAPAARGAALPGGASILLGLSCFTAADCWAVGAAGVNRDLNGAVHWNGSVWSNAATPKPRGTARDGRGLGGLACTSPSNCWAVGPALRAFGIHLQNEALHWNGTRWSYASIPGPGPFTQMPSLNAMACTSAANCWAVGDFDGTAGHAGGGQAVHWNGHKWVLWAQ